MITQKRLKELLSYNPETGVFTNLTQTRGRSLIGDAVGYKRPKGYIRIMIDYKLYYAHRLAWLYAYGGLPEKFIDHINETPSDNRLVNLRMATHQENAHNKSKPNIDNTSGFRGVSWYKPNKKWRAVINVNRKSKFLGYFDTPEEASEVYLKAKKELHTFWEELK